MRLIRNIFLFALLILLSNCSNIIKFVYGIHDQQIESKKAIYRHAIRMSIDTTNNFYVIDSSSAKKIMTGGFPKVYFYNSKGDLILPYHCFGQLKEYTDSLYKTNEFKVVNNKAIFDEMKNIRTFNNRKVEVELANTDFVIIYYWAAWMGKLNRIKLGWLENKIRKDKRKNIKLIKVNADFQKSWNWSDEKCETIFK